MTNFVVKIVRGELGIVGTVSSKVGGWRFLSRTSAHGNSRKGWPTAKEAIPSWAKPGYIATADTHQDAIDLIQGYRDGVTWAVMKADQIEMIHKGRIYA